MRRPAISLFDEQRTPPPVIGHRGCSNRAPENTLAAFALLREHGIPGAELDVHRCSTGEIVVAHDDTLERTAGVPLAIRETSLAELRTHDIGSWFAPEFASERIPLLSDVFETLGAAIFVDIEIKHYETRLGSARPGSVETETVRLIREHGLVGRCIVSSFDPLVLRRVHTIAPELPIATIYSADPDVPFFLRRNGGRRIAHATIMKPHHTAAGSGDVQRHHRGNRLVLPWTVDDPDLARELVRNGVDGIITNRPIEIRDAIAQA